MNITICPKCKMKVLPKTDGTCPSCGADIGQKAISTHLPKKTHAKISVTHVSNEHQEESDRGANPPQKRASLKETYKDYLQEAEGITRWATINILLPSLLLMALAIVAKPMAVSLISPKLAWAEVDKRYSPYTESFLASQYSAGDKVRAELYAATIRWQANLEFTIGWVAALIPIIGLVMAQRRMTLEATIVNKSMRGFKKFFQLGYGIIRKGSGWGRYWPKDFPDGDKKEEFLDIVARKR